MFFIIYICLAYFMADNFKALPGYIHIYAHTFLSNWVCIRWNKDYS